MQAINAKGISRSANTIVIAALVYIVMMTEMAWAAGDAPMLGLSNEVYTASVKALTMLFVTAVILESGFAVIFNWRVFLAYFDTKGLKTILMVLISALVVFYFKLDVFASLLAAFTVPETATDKAAIAASLATQVGQTSTWISKLITAFVLAGGSSGIHNLMYALGFRSSRDTEVTTKPDQNQAWVSISVKRKNINAPIQIGVVKVDSAPTEGTVVPLSGTVKFERPQLKDLLMRGLNRFPANGGYVVEPNKIYLISAVADAPAGKPGDQQMTYKTQPRYYTFSPGAVVDLTIEIVGPQPAVVDPVPLKVVAPAAV